MLQESFKEIFQKPFKNISRTFQEYFKGLSRVKCDRPNAKLSNNRVS